MNCAKSLGSVKRQKAFQHTAVPLIVNALIKFGAFLFFLL